MAKCTRCGKYVNNEGEVCGSCRSAINNTDKLTKRKLKESNSGTRLHGLYCLLIGWWLAMFIAILIVPLFFSGGRSLIKKAFGIW